MNDHGAGSLRNLTGDGTLTDEIERGSTRLSARYPSCDQRRLRSVRQYIAAVGVFNPTAPEISAILPTLIARASKSVWADFIMDKGLIGDTKGK
jgi:hypothetical protein